MQSVSAPWTAVRAPGTVTSIFSQEVTEDQSPSRTFGPCGANFQQFYPGKNQLQWSLRVRFQKNSHKVALGQGGQKEGGHPKLAMGTGPGVLMDCSYVNFSF